MPQTIHIANILEPSIHASSVLPSKLRIIRVESPILNAKAKCLIQKILGNYIGDDLDVTISSLNCSMSSVAPFFYKRSERNQLSKKS